MDLMPPPASDRPHGDDTVSVGDPMLGRTRLLSRQCDTCIFKPGNLMHLDERRLRDIVTTTRTRESHIVCHATLPHHGHPNTQPAICRGIADRHRTDALRLIARLWGFVEVDPPGDQPDTTAADTSHEQARP